MSTVAFGKDGAIARSASDLYRAVWRWHFYAGLLVLPFMITLAITGGLYLFKDELDGIIHANVKRVEIGQQTVPPSQMVTAALAAHPGTAVKFTDPPTPSSSAEITINAPEGKLAVYVSPYTGTVLGSLPDRGTVMWTIRYLHSLKYFGTYARYAIEIAGGWSILLVATGIYLWWPRTQTGGVVSVRGTPKRRVFWRDLHAVTGIFVGGFIVFLAITGMPWSGVWGGKVNEWANGNNFGYPAGVRVSVPMSNDRLDAVAKTSWSLEQAQIPMSSQAHEDHAAHGSHDSGDHAGHDGHANTPLPATSETATKSLIGIDAAIAKLKTLGLHAGYALNLPTTPTGVYTGSVYPDDLSQQRVVHLDQYSGEALIDMGYADYGPLGKGLEWGINVHMGQEFGLANQIVLAFACLAIILLAVSAAIMWWKRRPKGSLGVPPMPQDKTVFRGLLALLIIGGIIFPLVGVSLVVMLVLDVVVQKTAKRRTA
jgi:uncharacterized iron-regulated membrane protein